MKNFGALRCENASILLERKNLKKSTPSPHYIYTYFVCAEKDISDIRQALPAK